MNKKTLTFITTSILAVGIIGCMLWYVRDELVLAFQHADYSILIFVILCGIGSWIIRGVRYRYILHRLEISCSIVYSTTSILICQLVNIIVPARLGDFTRVFLFHKEKGLEYSAGFSSVIEERIFDVVAIFIFVILPLPFLYSYLDEWMRQVVIITAVLLLAIFSGLYASKYFNSENKILKKILIIIETLRNLALTPISTINIGLFSILIWCLEVFMCFMICKMFHAQISFIVVMFAVALANISKTIPLTPGGVGVYEVIVATILTIGGIPFGTATLVSVIDHLLKNLIPIIGGSISIYYFGDWIKELINKLSKEGKDSI